MSISIILKKYKANHPYTGRADVVRKFNKVVTLSKGMIVESKTYKNYYRVTKAGKLYAGENLDTKADLVFSEVELQYLGNRDETQPFNFIEYQDEALNLTNYLLFDEEFTIKHQVEGERPYAFFASYAEFVVNNDDEISSRFTTQNLAEFIFAVEIYVDGDFRFAGYINQDEVVEDKINGTWSISATDWVKYLFDYLGSSIWSKEYVSLTNFLRDVFITPLPPPSLPGEYPSIAQDVNIILPVTEYQDFSNTETADSINSGLFSLKNLLLELQKEYGAYIYMNIVDSLFTLNFVHAKEFKDSEPTAIDNYILDDSFTITPYIPKQFDSFVATVVEPGWTWDIKYFWGVFSRQNDEVIIRRATTSSQLDSITRDKTYLDLRQKLGVSDGGSSIIYNIKKILTWARTQDAVWQLFKHVLEPGQQATVAVTDIRLNLFNKVSVGSTEYQVFEITEYPFDNEQDLILKNYDGNTTPLNPFN